MVVVDTDVMIDVMNGKDAAVSYLDALLDGYRPVAVSAMTIMQLHHGIARSTMPLREQKMVETTLESLLTYPMDGDVASRAGQLDGGLSKRGEPIGVADTIIAATALERGEPVATRNEKHFRRIPGLNVETY